MYTVGHFQVPKTLAFKIKLSEKPFSTNQCYLHKNHRYINLQ